MVGFVGHAAATSNLGDIDAPTPGAVFPSGTFPSAIEFVVLLRALRCIGTIDFALCSGRELGTWNVFVEIEAEDTIKLPVFLRKHGFGNTDVIPNLILSPSSTKRLEVFRTGHCRVKVSLHLIPRHLGSLPRSLSGWRLVLQVFRLDLQLPLA